MTKHVEGRVEMHSTILGVLPSLTSRNKAIEFLKEEGFACEFVRDGGFDDRFGRVSNDHDPSLVSGGVVGETRTHRAFSNRNFILARRTDNGPFPAEEIWTIALTLDSNDVPEDVYIYHGYEK